MSKPSAELLKFMETYKVAKEEVWEVHGSTWVVKHKALERIAAEVGIVWDRPAIVTCDPANKIMVMVAFGKLGDRTEWSFGEAASYNNKNAYPAAMAEKRAKDRVILKLLNAHGALYSEAEADEFEKPEDETIGRDDNVQVLTVDAQRTIFSELQREINECDSVAGIKRWKVSARARASRLGDEWRKQLEKLYLAALRQLEKTEADEYIERKTANG